MIVPRLRPRRNSLRKSVAEMRTKAPHKIAANSRGSICLFVSYVMGTQLLVNVTRVGGGAAEGVWKAVMSMSAGLAGGTPATRRLRQNDSEGNPYGGP